MVILVYPNVRNVVVSGQWENNCSNNVPDVPINTNNKHILIGVLILEHLFWLQ